MIQDDAFDNKNRAIFEWKNSRVLFTFFRKENKMNSTDENRMPEYQRTLKAVADAAGSSLSHGESPEELEQNINPNTVYGVRCSDREEYYRTVYLKPHPFTSNLGDGV